MKIEKLEELTCKYFNVTPEELHATNKKCKDEVAVARHCLRAFAVTNGIEPKELVSHFKIHHSTIASSKKLILINGVFDKEYQAYRAYMALKDNDSTVIDKDSKIERVTNNVFDERFYKHPSKINPRTNNPYFPAFHFLTKLGAPEPVGLTKWRQDKGHFADYILERSAEIGSFVHDSIDNMIKHNAVIDMDMIADAFPNPKEAHRVRECLYGFLLFMKEEEPVIIASEKMMCGEDFGFTLDAEMRLKRDSYKSKWTVDWKTSKVANEDHKMQVEVMRRVSGSDKGMIVVLGNSTKKKYTATPITSTKQDYYWNRFTTIKDAAYVEMLDKGTVAPREDVIPLKFSLQGLNVTRKI